MSENISTDFLKKLSAQGLSSVSYALILDRLKTAPASATDLAKTCGVSTAAMTNLLDALTSHPNSRRIAKDALVESVMDPQIDARRS